MRYWLMKSEPDEFSIDDLVRAMGQTTSWFGVRTYQVSDTREAHSFNDYQINRWITCAAMIVIGIGYCMVRGYGAEMFSISMGVFVYKMIAEGTVEEKMVELQAKKKALVDSVLSGTAAGLSFTEDDIESLFAPLPE